MNANFRLRIFIIGFLLVVGSVSLPFYVKAQTILNKSLVESPQRGDFSNPDAISSDGYSEKSGSQAVDAVSAPLWDNGPLVNCPGCGFRGADESNRQNISLGMTSLGFPNQIRMNRWVADDFAIDPLDGWTISQVTVYGYQAASTSKSTFDTLHVRIWNGPPGEIGSIIVWGDKTTNVLKETGWTNIFRASEDTSGTDTDRPVMYLTAEIDHHLPQGTYWLDWQADGKLDDGPFVPPITVNGVTTTGNGIQSSDGGATYSNSVDRGTRTQQGFPFVVEGRVGRLSISLNATVTKDIGNCPGSKSVVINPGEQVSFCWTTTNDGTITLSLHDLASTLLGSIVTELPYELVPGGIPASAGTGGVTINENMVISSTWTAYNPGPIDVATSDDVVYIYVRGPDPVVCNGPVIGFNAGIPSDWSVVNNAGGNPVIWADLAGCGEPGNFTGGSGDAACASSDKQGSGLYDTELVTSPFSLAGWSGAQLSFLLNYQNMGTVDHFLVDITTNNGASWSNLMDTNADHGSWRSASGELVNLDLGDYAGESNVKLRWRYYDPSGPIDELDWYIQIDDIAVTCSYLNWLPTILTGP